MIGMSFLSCSCSLRLICILIQAKILEEIEERMGTQNISIESYLDILFLRKKS